jgi:Uma2 family endonuclease
MVIEILSPSTRRHDRLVKLDLYQRSGVQEYWIVDPENQSVQVFLQDGTGSLKLREDYGREDIAKVNALDGCFVELAKVFPK